MPQPIAPLSATKIKAAKPSTKEFKLFDGGVLYLLAPSTGGKLVAAQVSF